MSVTLDKLAQEVASSPFAQHFNITKTHIVSAWTAFGEFCGAQILDGKGVQVPTVGTFYVAKALDAFLRPAGTIRPFFYLLEGRFNSVPQFKGNVFPASRGTIVPPSYNQIAKRCGVDRVHVQRVLRELLALLGAEIKSRKSVRVPFPEVGVLFTNKDGRVQFAFDKGLLLEVNDRFAAPKALKADLAKARDEAPQDPLAEVALLRSLCAATDRIGSRCVARLQLEELLSRHCKEALALLDAKSVLGMLTAHVFGKSGKFVNYVTLLEDLERRVREATTGTQARPRQPSHARQLLEAEEDQEEQGIEEEEDGARAQTGAEEEQVDEEQEDMSAPPAVTFAAAAGQEAVPNQTSVPLPLQSEPLYYPPARPQTAPNRPTPSRSEIDAFNRLHFERLYQERGWREHRKREVTPKVGEDRRNVQAWATESERRSLSPGPRNALADALGEQVEARRSQAQVRRALERQEARDRNERASAQAEADALSVLEKKKETVRLLKEAWAEQARAREEVKRSLTALESKWPYVPLHDHTNKLPLFDQPKYVRPFYVSQE